MGFLLDLLVSPATVVGGFVSGFVAASVAELRRARLDRLGVIVAAIRLVIELREAVRRSRVDSVRGVAGGKAPLSVEIPSRVLAALTGDAPEAGTHRGSSSAAAVRMNVGVLREDFIRTSRWPVIQVDERHRILVGSSREADWRFRVATVSRKHCELHSGVDGESWVVRDLGSRNGTFVNGAAVVHPTAVTSMDSISLGRSTHFRIVGAAHG